MDTIQATPAVENQAITPAIPATTPEAKAPEATPDKFAARFAQLQAREREIQKSREQIKAEKEGWKQSEDFKAFEQWKAKQDTYRKDPMTLLKDYDYDYDKVTRRLLDGEKPEAVDPAELARKAAREEYESREAKQKEAQEAKDKEEIEKGRTKEIGSIAKHLEANKEKYELCAATKGSDQLIFDIIKLNLQRSIEEGKEPEILTYDQAAELAEKEFEVEAEKILSLSKIKKRFQPAEEKKIDTKPVMPSVTLSNKMQSQVATPGPTGTILDKEKSVREAAKLLKWS